MSPPGQVRVEVVLGRHLLHLGVLVQVTPPFRVGIVAAVMRLWQIEVGISVKSPSRAEAEARQPLQVGVKD